ncbi:PREDICTED: RNA-binding protein 27 [Drosophila arizonae]|uniref:RNA-binding protein 27 n=1 Tax=Drosophila arizonae TaxID=7263 RepID=A0ABM1NVR3_DROAR|nr:PREDICTED: RNA-binding protein 27 [Drosophila arizonae]
MILENSDKLKDWLSVVLEPLCDADSSALARYVIALLKKDKSDKDLKRIMIEQLDVFLSEETTRFVDRLFDAIASEEYLSMPTPMPVSTANIAELELEPDLDGVAEIEAVVNSSPPSPSPTTAPKDIVIKADNNQQQLRSDNSSRETAIEASSAMPTDANTTGTHSTKIAFDHKTKDSHSQQQQLMHHHHSSTSGGSSVNASGFVRSASPPLRSSGPAGAYAADKENQPRDSRRRRASLRSRSRSRSRSNERSFRRSRSRDRRINEREKSQRQFRNKSPPGGTSEQRHRRSNNNNSTNSTNNFDRRRIGNNNSSNNNSSMDERTQRFGKSRHSPRSRSISPESRNARRGANISSNNINNSSNNMEAAACSSAAVVAPAAPMPLPVSHPVAAMGRQRCRDFDEKGYCVRGETCPWDHGINPVVFEGINNSALMMSMREYNPDAPEIWARGGPAGVPGVPQPGGGPPQALPVPPQGGPSSINPFSGNVRACAPHGVPNPADYARQPGQPPQVPAPPPMMPFPFNPTAVTTPLQRQLIPIPVMDGGVGGGVGSGGGGGLAADMGKRRFELEDSVAIADVPSKMRKLPINSRLGPRVNPNMQQHNSSLELRKVPRGLNTIAHLNNHFAKFGKIVNIQVSYEGDPEAAIVTFSTHAEANVAYRSTEAVLNNRFIKVFWHNDNNSNSGSNNNNNNNNIVNESGNPNVNRKSQYHLHNVPAMPTPNADSAKITNTNNNSSQPNQATPLGETNNALAAPTTEQGLASTAAPASMRLKLNANATAANASATGVARALTPAVNAATIRKKQEEQQKAMHQLANGLRKRKQELLQSYVKQMKTALELVERMDQQDAQRAPTLETIKVLQATIDKLRKDVHADQDQLQAQIQQQQQQQQQTLPVKKTKEQQKKELLDMELELIAQQQEGNDTTAIQKRLEELQRTLSASTGGGSLSGGGGAKLPGGGARKRATYPEGPTRVDRRPKAIVVTGFAAEEADFVLGHFKHFGEISKHDVDREIPQLIISYATRLNAEQAVLRGKIYKDKRLQISWAPVVSTPAVVPMGAPADKSPGALTTSTSGDKMDNPKQLLHSSVSESESLLGSDTLPELRLEDEEEDEESEDRSWRR